MQVTNTFVNPAQTVAHPLPPLTKGQIDRVRHKAEIPLYVICIIIGIIAAILAFDYIVFGGFFSDDAEAVSTSVVAAVMSEDDFAEDEEEAVGSFLFLVFFSPIILFFVMHLWYAETRAYSVRVTEKNFPEIYHKSVEFAYRLGLKKVPAVYIQQQNGILNAFAAAIIGKRYSMLNAELVDVAYMEHRDFEAVYFTLAHEFGHIYFKHVTIWHNIMTFVAHMIPVFGQLHSRSREYSCDRVAQLLMGHNCVQEEMVFTAGRHLYKYVDVADYLETVKKDRGIFLWFVNLLATHPIPPKRVAALVDPQMKSGKLF
ncbi:MAG: M48 family metallopeptidase [Oscillospiraceae bacterium]|nr:M48 family metallopeptidase [Oscillospiraceae bacterium]